MKKSELVIWLREEHREWEAFLDQIDPAYMEEPGVVGQWSMKDVIGHLTGWNRNLVARLQAAQRSEPEPPPPWPAHLQEDDEINAWLYETNRGLSVGEIREQTDQVFKALFAAVDALPDDVRIETVHHEGGDYYRIWLEDQNFLPGEFFDHYRDDHEAEVREWLDQKKEQ